MPGDPSSASQHFGSDPFGPLIGQRGNGCWLGYASVLFLEIGELKPKQNHHHPEGEFSLWPDCILWHIENYDRVVAGSHDDERIMEAAVDQLNGRVLLSGEISELTVRLNFEISDGYVLRTFVWTTEEDARWHFGRRDAEYVLLGPSLELDQSRSDDITRG